MRIVSILDVAQIYFCQAIPRSVRFRGPIRINNKCPNNINIGEFEVDICN